MATKGEKKYLFHIVTIEYLEHLVIPAHQQMFVGLRGIRKHFVQAALLKGCGKVRVKDRMLRLILPILSAYPLVFDGSDVSFLAPVE